MGMARNYNDLRCYLCCRLRAWAGPVLQTRVFAWAWPVTQCSVTCEPGDGLYPIHLHIAYILYVPFMGMARKCYIWTLESEHGHGPY